MENDAFKAMIVSLILDGKIEEALDQLANHYKIHPPKMTIGLPKGSRRNVLGCYTAKNETISVLNSDAFRQPLIILHEFYHHLRTNVDRKHKGTEKYANKFAEEYARAYRER